MLCQIKDLLFMVFLASIQMMMLFNVIHLPSIQYFDEASDSDNVFSKLSDLSHEYASHEVDHLHECY